MKNKLLKLPDYPRGQISDDGVYLVETVDKEILFCTSDVAFNQDGETKSLSNEKVFRCIDPSFNNIDMLLHADRVLRYKLVDRSFAYDEGVR